MYPAEAHLDLVTGQSFLHKAESVRTISSKISFRRRYTWCKTIIRYDEILQFMMNAFFVSVQVLQRSA